MMWGMPIGVYSLATYTAVYVATEMVDQVGGWAADGSKLGVLAGGMVLAYRIAAKAQRDAVVLYKEAAADADARLDKERKDWERERAQLYDELARMRGHQP